MKVVKILLFFLIGTNALSQNPSEITDILKAAKDSSNPETSISILAQHIYIFRMTSNNLFILKSNADSILIKKIIDYTKNNLNSEIKQKKKKKENNDTISFNYAFKKINQRLLQDSNNSKLFFYKSLLNISLSNDKEVETLLKKTISCDSINNLTNYKEHAIEIAKTYFFLRAKEQINRRYYDQAIGLYKKIFLFDREYENAWYELAMTYCELGRWNESIEAANFSLLYNKGTDESKSKNYLVLGRAYQGNRQEDKACESFKKTIDGIYKTQAEFLMKSLQCN